MVNKELDEKQTYYEAQGLLDNSDDEESHPFKSSTAIGALTSSMAPSSNAKGHKRTYSFLGPTPREEQAARKTAVTHLDSKLSDQLVTAPEKSLDSGLPATKAKQVEKTMPETKPSRRRKTENQAPNSIAESQIPFWKRRGFIPRELKQGKNVKPAENIQLFPEHKQLLKGKIVYFFPNDDINTTRRHRLHIIIRLGAAWVKTWSDDVTHIIFDDKEQTYDQLLRHLRRSDFPGDIAIVKYQPYITESIEFNKLQDPTSGRFQVTGAPSPKQTINALGFSLHTPGNSSAVTFAEKQAANVPSEVPNVESFERDTNVALETTYGPSSFAKDVVEESFEAPPPSFNVESNGSSSYNDALSEAIQETKAISHLPIDEDDEDMTTSADLSGDSENETEDEAPEPVRKKTRTVPPVHTAKQAGYRGQFNQSTFRCMNPNSSKDSQNPNARTIQILEEMCKYYDQVKDQWRTMAYRNGIASLRKQTAKIVTAKQAVALPYIGTRLAEKIEEIVLTDRLRRLDSTKDDPMDRILRLFLGVYGAGLNQANKWIQSGHRSLEDLLQEAKLTESQKVGVEHYADFNSRIPRAEVEAHGAFVRDALHAIDPECEVTIMGSYRRGAKDSGDIDCIITKPSTSLSTLRTIVFESLVPALYKSDFLKVGLATSSRTNDGSKWHGASCLPSSTTWRRLDLLLVPKQEIGAALLYFTGNDIFNRSMRLLASKKGMRLNQRGLYEDVVRGPNRERINQGTLIEGRSEKRIFELLGVPWREPHERVC
ncbi:hypothetical protein BS50DRAFT_606900 [Corynespora cassiicola Philippines]|uniref:DNA-directed DNA polymerase n=1 Tax=Corynespora cassiicola Philippines TaxID=1448308 RepID=A0A2T2P650_CORCC|nr:hypothetical protein BS50DRAFT_606900 [Corynespora cassiicola Philippines]